MKYIILTDISDDRRCAIPCDSVIAIFDNGDHRSVNYRLSPHIVSTDGIGFIKVAQSLEYIVSKLEDASTDHQT